MDGDLGPAVEDGRLDLADEGPETTELLDGDVDRTIPGGLDNKNLTLRSTGEGGEQSGHPVGLPPGQG
jgi:hypothetical protein